MHTYQGDWPSLVIEITNLPPRTYGRTDQGNRCSCVRLPPPDNRSNEAENRGACLHADYHPGTDRCDIPEKHLRRRRPPVQNISIEQYDFSLDEAMPRGAAAGETECDRDDAIADVKKKVHGPTAH